MYNKMKICRLIIPFIHSFVLILIFASSPLAHQASAASKKLNPLDLWSMVELSDPQISPNNRQIVVVVSRVDRDDYRYDSKLVLVDIESREQRILAHNLLYPAHPRWSPKGEYLAFLAPAEHQKNQVFLLTLEGSEVTQLTHSPTGVLTFDWRPNGEDIAYVSRDEPEKKTGRQKHNKSFEAGNSSFLTSAAPTSAHLWLIAVKASKAKRLTQGAASVGGLYSGDSFSWSPDGKSILFVTQPNPHTSESANSVIKSLDIATGLQTVVVERAPHTFVPAWAAAYSPDGAYIAYHRSSLNAGPLLTPTGLYLLSAEGGKEFHLSASIDRSIAGQWLPDGKSLLVTGIDGTRTRAWQLALDGHAKKLDFGDVDVQGRLSIGFNRAVAFVGATSDRPKELYYLSGPGAKVRRLTDFNAEIAARQLGEVKSISWNGPDGFKENGVLVYPPDFDASKKYPLVLNIHGGPMWASTEAFSIQNQIMAAKGWIVFSPNYRGSINLGTEYQLAIVGDAGEGPGRDIMAGVEAVKALGIIDDKRIAVSGWSYGGFMTAWLASHYDIWAAAVAGAPITDWFDQYNLTDINVGFGREVIKTTAADVTGSPWLHNNAEKYWKQSPIAYAHQIRAPTLLLHNSGDERVSITASYKLYHALKDNKVPVKFVVYPIPGHYPLDPVHQLDVTERWIDWIDARFNGLAVSP